jgi:mRNA interferase HigB
VWHTSAGWCSCPEVLSSSDRGVKRDAHTRKKPKFDYRQFPQNAQNSDLFPYWEHASLYDVRIIVVSTPRQFWRENGDAEDPLKAWYQEVKSADWSTPHQLKTMYRSASVIGDNRVVFNIAGNKYRLIVKFNYSHRVGYVRFIGTHAEYDRIDAEDV